MSDSEDAGLDSLAPAVENAAAGKEGATGKTVNPRWWLTIPIGFLAIAFTALWLYVWANLDNIYWPEDFVEDNTWIAPILVVGFSLLVGVCVKYLHASTMIGGTMADSMKAEGETRTSFRSFWGTLPSSIYSLLSGASVGPEGPLALLVEDITDWISVKLNIVKTSWLGLRVAALASAYNGLIGSPVFTAVFATEFHVGKKNSLQFLAWNLIAGSIGFFVYYMLGWHSFMGSIQFPDLEAMESVYILYAILLGVVGALIALLAIIMFKVVGKLMGMFGNRIMLRILVAGLVTAVVVYFLPELMFSGEATIHGIIDSVWEGEDYDIAILLLFALLKLFLLAMALKSGFVGGPIFPVMFSSTMVALALSIALPDLPIILLVLCIEAAAITLVLTAPLTAILLTTVVAAAGSFSVELLGLIVVATVTSMVIGGYAKTLMMGRSAKSGGTAGQA